MTRLPIPIFLPAALCLALLLTATAMRVSADATAVPSASVSGQGIVTVDMSQTVVTPTMGFGVQFDPYSYPPSPADWQLTLKRLDAMHPGFFRVMFSADYCLDFDAQGKPEYIWDKPGDASAHAKSEMAMVYQILDYAQARHVDVMLGEWEWRHYIPMADGGKQITSAADPRWARMITDFVTYLTRVKKYTILKYYNYMNEPNGVWMGKVDYAAWAQGIRQLHTDFVQAGLNEIAIVGPDNSGDWQWLDWSARDLSKEIGDWEMHWYPTDDMIVQGQIEPLLNDKREMLLKTDPDAAAKRRFMGEAGDIQGRMNGDQQPRVRDFDYGVLMADYGAQILRAGWMGASAWDLDDAMHTVGAYVVPPNDKTLKVWGFWNTQAAAMGHPEDLAIRPWFYTWSLMAHLFPKGAQVVAATEPSDMDGFRAVACRWRSGRRDHLSVMLVNDTDDARTITLRVPNAAPQDMTMYRYFQNERPADADGFPVPASRLAHAPLEQGVTVALPSRGVVFLTSG